MVKFIAEVGINHNGSVEDCKKLIMLSKIAGADFVIISTGMSTEEEVIEAINIGNPDVIMHTNSTYPCSVDELNLNYIIYLKNKYNKEIGYSGHELELSTTYTAIGLGTSWIERHITMDRNLWGSDQKASIEPNEFIEMVREIRKSTKI